MAMGFGLRTLMPLSDKPNQVKCRGCEKVAKTGATGERLQARIAEGLQLGFQVVGASGAWGLGLFCWIFVGLEDLSTLRL